jgi:hypothetical protein
MDEAKSKVAANSVKNPTVTYEMAGDQIKCTTDGVDAKGNPQHTEWTGKFDGKDYPLTGKTDSRAYTMVNDHTLTFVSKKDGKTTVNGTITVSADGKTRTLKNTAVDAGWLQKVLGNLLGNAMKYSAADQPVFLSAEFQGNMVAISIADRGIDIDPLEQEMIFDKLYRSRLLREQSPHKRISGTGMAWPFLRRS